jgi:hypothetical protein
MQILKGNHDGQVGEVTIRPAINLHNEPKCAQANLSCTNGFNTAFFDRNASASKTETKFSTIAKY